MKRFAVPAAVLLASVLAAADEPAARPAKEALADPSVNALTYILERYGPATKVEKTKGRKLGESRMRLSYRSTDVMFVLKDAKPPAGAVNHWRLVGVSGAASGVSLTVEKAEQRFKEAEERDKRAATKRAAESEAAARAAEADRVAAAREADRMKPGTHEMAVRAFVSELPDAYVVLTMRCRLSDDFPPFVRDLRTSEYGVEMLEPKTGEYLFGVAPRNRTDGRAVFDLLKDGKFRPLTLKVAILRSGSDRVPNRDRVVTIQAAQPVPDALAPARGGK